MTSEDISLRSSRIRSHFVVTRSIVEIAPTFLSGNMQPSVPGGWISGAGGRVAKRAWAPGFVDGLGAD